MLWCYQLRRIRGFLASFERLGSKRGEQKATTEVYKYTVDWNSTCAAKRSWQRKQVKRHHPLKFTTTISYKNWYDANQTIQTGRLYLEPRICSRLGSRGRGSAPAQCLPAIWAHWDSCLLCGCAKPVEHLVEVIVVSDMSQNLDACIPPR
jgi:hypothetical protein